MDCLVKFLAGRIASFGHALRGLAHVLQTQRNARIHLGVAVLVALFGLAVGLHASAWLWLAQAIALVWITEVLNTAVEYLCDVVSPEHSQAVKRAKDIAAGAVLIAAAYAVIVGLGVFLPALAA